MFSWTTTPRLYGITFASVRGETGAVTASETFNISNRMGDDPQGRILPWIVEEANRAVPDCMPSIPAFSEAEHIAARERRIRQQEEDRGGGGSWERFAPGALSGTGTVAFPIPDSVTDGHIVAPHGPDNDPYGDNPDPIPDGVTLLAIPLNYSRSSAEPPRWALCTANLICSSREHGSVFITADSCRRGWKSSGRAMRLLDSEHRLTASMETIGGDNFRGDSIGLEDIRSVSVGQPNGIMIFKTRMRVNNPTPSLSLARQSPNHMPASGVGALWSWGRDTDRTGRNHYYKFRRGSIQFDSDSSRPGAVSKWRGINATQLRTGTVGDIGAAIYGNDNKIYAIWFNEIEGTDVKRGSAYNIEAAFNDIRAAANELIPDCIDADGNPPARRRSASSGEGQSDGTALVSTEAENEEAPTAAPEPSLSPAGESESFSDPFDASFR